MLVASTVRGNWWRYKQTRASANETICNENGKHPTTSDRYTRHSCERSHFTSFQAGSHSQAHVYRICNTWRYTRETRVRQSRKISFPSAPRRWHPESMRAASTTRMNPFPPRLWRSRDTSHEGNFYHVRRWGYSLPRIRLRSPYALLFREVRNKISKLERCSWRKLNMSTRSLERNGISRRYTGVLKRAFKRNVQHNDTCKKFMEK